MTFIASWLAFVFAVLSLYACVPHAVQRAPTAALCRTEAYFSRRGGAAPALLSLLDQAHTSIHVAIYGLTNIQIVDSLLAAKQRGVAVALKLDKIESAGKAQAAMIAKLQAAGVTVEVSEQVRLLHHKFAVIDNRYVVTGSYNWTLNAEQRNRENMVIMECPEMVQAFSAEWDSIQRDKP